MFTLSAKQKQFISKCSELNYLIDEETDQADGSLLKHVNSIYYDLTEFNQIELDNKSSSFGFIHLNIASLQKYFDDLDLLLSQVNHSFDIIGITEHKLNNDAPFSNFDLPGYSPFLFAATETTHGGAGFFLRNNLNYTLRDDLCFNSAGNFESIFVEIEFQKKNLVVGCIYRHPNSKISIVDFTTNHLEPILHKISKENKQCVLMGDFNINLLKFDVLSSSKHFYNCFSSHFFSPFIPQPSRLVSNTLIDNIMFNSLEYNTYSGNLLVQISDHLAQFLLIEGFNQGPTKLTSNLYKRDFSRFNEHDFQKDLTNLDWHSICNFDSADANIACRNLVEHITHLLDQHAPYKKRSKKDLNRMHKP